ncbi:MAG: PAS domain-containing protein, partial [Planctomycetes bacterium]|nr:PAS domain-containing protein [Planctomycetota bacterium]
MTPRRPSLLRFAAALGAVAAAAGAVASVVIGGAVESRIREAHLARAGAEVAAAAAGVAVATTQAAAGETLDHFVNHGGALGALLAVDAPDGWKVAAAAGRAEGGEKTPAPGARLADLADAFAGADALARDAVARGQPVAVHDRAAGAIACAAPFTPSAGAAWLAGQVIGAPGAAPPGAAAVYARIDDRALAADTRSALLTLNAGIAAVVALMFAAALLLARRLAAPAANRPADPSPGRALLDAAAAVAWVKAPDGRYAFVNQRFLDTFRTTRDEVVGRDDFDLFPHDTARMFAAHETAVRQHGASAVTTETVPTHDGPRAWLTMRFAAPPAAGERAGSICGLSIDVADLPPAPAQVAAVEEHASARRRAEEAVARATADARRAEAERTRTGEENRAAAAESARLRDLAAAAQATAGRDQEAAAREKETAARAVAEVQRAQAERARALEESAAATAGQAALLARLASGYVADLPLRVAALNLAFQAGDLARVGELLA